MNDFIDCGRKGIARLDQIFIHELHGKKRLFAKVTQLEVVPGQLDHVLRLQMYRVVPHSIIVGLPRITANYPYVLPVEEDFEAQSRDGIPGLRLVEDRNAAQSFMLVDYTIHYL